MSNLAFAQIIASELSVNINQVQAAIDLLDEGATVPFISRYRKEATGGLTDTHLRDLEERLTYLRELDDRKKTILKSIKEQGKLDATLEAKINNVANKTELEDLYLPFKPKRRTKGQIAIEAGLLPLAELLLTDQSIDPKIAAQKFINVENKINTTEDALDGAKAILSEQFAENPELVQRCREYMWEHALIISEVMPDKREEKTKFSDYYSFSEPLKRIPSHRALALLRGRNESILSLKLALKDEASMEHPCITFVSAFANAQSPWLKEVAQWTWKVKLAISTELALMTRMRENAELEAIRVFKENLRDLLMAPPAGMRTTLGLDPGFRTGVKTAVVDETGKLVHYETIFPHMPQNKQKESLLTLAKICKHYHVKLISIGNGTACRETEDLVKALMKAMPELNLSYIVVSEAGASVYSASQLASEEMPDVDVSYRGAASIARRLQDPLAELVKIDPKSIGVGQYQHDLNQIRLAKGLDAIVEDCVNAIGVDVNTASAPLLRRISGLNPNIAQAILTYRNEHGQFKTRNDLKKVPSLGPKTFQQAAGFLRIIGGKNPLDASAVHPEAYPVVEKILTDIHLPITQAIGNKEVLTKINININNYADQSIGVVTLKDILRELEKPGRDPRPSFKTVQYKAGVEKISDLTEGMILEGVITNVANFGAFVDIGVHQDGLVHISELADKFVDDPRSVVKTGQIVTVRVLTADAERKRIQLSMRLQPSSNIPAPQAKNPAPIKKPLPKQEKMQSAMAEKLKDLFGR
ncbi:MAG: Tex family protein [Gammaproteobacteria bacterium]